MRKFFFVCPKDAVKNISIYRFGRDQTWDKSQFVPVSCKIAIMPETGIMAIFTLTFANYRLLFRNGY
ncbi:hypothetical protein EPJ63_08275 [Pediococcus acidilactici]|nr:hypothetical protein GBO58_00440 [Pediococcus acidilactici]KAF0384240.1 hypothetical protein GBO62_01385 [Pediococcus acidilactici]KAF0458172.1 hypothetical protein GBP02_01385 [Pediococcus acidilactici]KAF0477594.1 hypothetical protein GBP10_01680 [Pediococcus acidilactici]KAF0537815.1 hypothetical protein GBP37_00440 [Pediococcus acidilactici]